MNLEHQPPHNEGAFNGFFIDSHCHLNSKEFRHDVENFIAKARVAGVRRFLVVGADYETSVEAVELAQKFEGVFASVGVHPHDAKKLTRDFSEEFYSLFKSQKVVAIGETGLDFFYDHSPRDVQKSVFREHIRAAKKFDLPIILHIREAMDDALAIMREERADELRGVFHCYAGGLAYLEQALSFGYHISFSGVITYPKNDELREVARVVPVEKILCETDCPYLAPKPFRGKLNEPANVRYVYETIAHERGVSVEELAIQVQKNFLELFGKNV